MPVQQRRESVIAKQQAPLRRLYSADPSAALGTDPRRLNAVVAAAERVCVNLDTLRSGVEVTTTTEIVGS